MLRKDVNEEEENLYTYNYAEISRPLKELTSKENKENYSYTLKEIALEIAKVFGGRETIILENMNCIQYKKGKKWWKIIFYVKPNINCEDSTIQYTQEVD